MRGIYSNGRVGGRGALQIVDDGKFRGRIRYRIGLEQRRVFRRGVPIVPVSQLLRHEPGHRRALPDEGSIGLDHALARYGAIRVAMNVERKQGGLDFRHGPAAIGKIHRLDPANARWPAQFEVGANHRGEVRGVVRTPCGFDAQFEPRGIGWTADKAK